MAEKRYYYKTKDGKGLLNLKFPLSKEEIKEKKYEEITAEEFASLQPQPHEPTAAERAKQEKLREIATLKGELAKTDYVVIKIAECETVEEQSALRTEYASVIADRKAKRTRINALLEELE